MKFPKLRHRKSKGEWAEIAFMAKATGLGLTVCKPYGENHRFDFLVQAHGNWVTRVQVKSAWSCSGSRGYQFKTSGSGRPYRLGEVDFIVAYVVPEDAWYVIPIAEVRKRDAVVVSPHVPFSHSKYEKYREAWHLLERAGCRVDLQACADPFAEMYFTAEGAEGAERILGENIDPSSTLSRVDSG